MTEHDGLTAEQEARAAFISWAWQQSDSHKDFRSWVAGAEWATEREKVRAEAAEAALLKARDAIEAMVQSGRVRTRDIDNFPASYEISATSWEAFHDLHWVICQIIPAPTTEAVTEVEGS